MTVDYHNGNVNQIRSLVGESLNCSYAFKYECHAVLMRDMLIIGFDGVAHKKWWEKPVVGICKGINLFIVRNLDFAKFQYRR